MVIKDKIVTSLFCDETEYIKYHQILLPQQLLTELLRVLHGFAHKHPGISKTLQEIR